MRIVSFMHEGETHVGYVVGDVVHDGGRRPDRIIPADPVCAAGKEIRATGLQLPLHEVSLLGPIPWPPKVIGVGLNYAEHAHETGAANPPTEPMIFPIIPSAVAAHRAAVQVPPEPYSDSLDYEAELAVVIGREAKAVPTASALDYVFGYACANDISSRKPQWQDNWVFGNGCDGFLPLGPWIVTAEELPDPQSLDIRCHVNGSLTQAANTRDMIFPVADLVAYISQAVTLFPGDVIATGTPAGVGARQDPPVFLRPGDEMRVEVAGIGELVNTVAT